MTLNDDIVSQRDVPSVDAVLERWHKRLWPNSTFLELAEQPPTNRSLFEPPLT